ncbi:MAG: hypothetical protein IVW53_12265 [Chloroflexi bacterium]|nr:hypothetical protein [Chloroflexota bacterium]
MTSRDDHGERSRSSRPMGTLGPHDRHDGIVIAAYAADDLTGVDLAAAAALVDGCPDCALLAADLRSIAIATSVLPVPPRERDFRLSTTDAARLRRSHHWWMLGGLARGGWPLRPVGVGLATLGLAGLLFSTIPGVGSTFLGTTGGVTTNRAGAAGSAAAAVPSMPTDALAPALGAAVEPSPPRPGVAVPGGPVAAASAVPTSKSAPAASAATVPEAAASRGIAGSQPVPGSVVAVRPPDWGAIVAVASGVLVLAGLLLVLVGTVIRRRATV